MHDGCIIDFITRSRTTAEESTVDGQNGKGIGTSAKPSQSTAPAGAPEAREEESPRSRYWDKTVVALDGSARGRFVIDPEKQRWQVVVTREDSDYERVLRGVNCGEDHRRFIEDFLIAMFGESAQND